MRTFIFRSRESRQQAAKRRRNVNRRNFLRVESLEGRAMMSGVPALAANDLYQAMVDQPLTVEAAGVLANDTDADGDALTAQLFTGPTSGSVSLNADGSFTYTPNSGFVGLDSFVYSAHDGTSSSMLAAVTIRVGVEADSPVAADDSFQVAEDGVLSIGLSEGVLANDTNASGLGMTASLVSGPAHGALTLAADGSFVYTPSPDFFGVDSFSYTAVNSAGQSNTATVSVTVDPVNDAPAAANDSYTVDEDGSLTTTLPSILGNDSDPDGDVLVPTIENGPLNGTVTLNADGTFTYTPGANFTGVDGFSYTVSDGTVESDAATVTISVSAVNDLPVSVNDEYALSEDTPLNIDAAAGVLANDFDLEGETLTAVIVSPPQHGSVTLNADGSFAYTPAGDYSGVDGFSYLATDGLGQSTVATVTLNITPVNDAPATEDDAYTLAEDGALTIDAATGVLANDTDADQDALAAALVSGPAHGTLTLAADGSFVYTPGGDFHGSDSFTYSADDGQGGTAEATVTITVSPENDAPLAVADGYTTAEDTVFSIGSLGLLSNDSDVDGDALTASLVSGPANGSVVVNSDGSFQYTPSANFHGADTFVYSVSDGVVTSEATVTMTVTPVSDAPIVAPDAYSTGEDVPLSIDAGLGVLANDLAGEGGGLTAQVVTPPEHGTLAMNADGSFNFTPETNWHGTATFTYQAVGADGEVTTGTATIIVQPLNDMPVAVDDSFEVEADMTGSVTGNDSDVDGDPLTTALIQGPASGELTLNSDGSFSYTPEEGFEGDVSFRYQLNDGMANSNVATVTLHVSSGPEGLPPVSGADAYTVDAGATLTVDAAGGVLANDSGDGGVSLTAVLVDPPGSGDLVLNSDGSFSYTPADGFSGQVSFTYKAMDGTLEGAVTTVLIDVLPVEANSPPVAADDVYDAEADSTLVVEGNGILANDTDADGDVLEAALVAAPTNGLVTLNPDGSFTYEPLPGFTGTDSFTYQASDGADASNTATVTINVAAAENTRPIAVNDVYTVPAGETTAVPAAGVLANDTDAQGDPLVASLFSGPLHGSVTLNADGSFSYTPNEGYTGLDSFMYWVFDGELNSALAAVTLHVEGPAESPVEPSEPVEPVDPPCDDDQEGNADCDPHPVDCLVADESLDPWSIDAALEDEDWLA